MVVGGEVEVGWRWGGGEVEVKWRWGGGEMEVGQLMFDWTVRRKRPKFQKSPSK